MNFLSRKKKARCSVRFADRDTWHGSFRLRRRSISMSAVIRPVFPRRQAAGCSLRMMPVIRSLRSARIVAKYWFIFSRMVIRSGFAPSAAISSMTLADIRILRAEEGDHAVILKRITVSCNPGFFIGELLTKLTNQQLSNFVPYTQIFCQCNSAHIVGTIYV